MPGAVCLRYKAPASRCSSKCCQPMPIRRRLLANGKAPPPPPATLHSPRGKAANSSAKLGHSPPLPSTFAGRRIAGWRGSGCYKCSRVRADTQRPLPLPRAPPVGLENAPASLHSFSSSSLSAAAAFQQQQQQPFQPFCLPSLLRARFIGRRRRRHGHGHGSRGSDCGGHLALWPIA